MGHPQVVFTGTFEHTIDAKNRLAIPSEIRSELQSASGSKHITPGNESQPPSEAPSLYVYVILGEGQSLSLYSPEVFEQRADQLDASPADTDELLTYERVLFSLAKRVELDKQGRIVLPENLLQMSKLGKEVVLIGAKDHVEIRDRQVWQEQVRQLLEQNPKLLSNPRRFIRPGVAPAKPN